MTTLAGKTIPPLFGGGGPAQELIFLIGFGAPQEYNEDVATDGSNLAKPATSAGDTLFVFANLSDSFGAPTQTGWVALTGILNNNQGRIYIRIADDTADDNFSWASGQFGNGVAIFAAFGVTTAGKSLEHLSSNVQLQVTNTAWGINLVTDGGPVNDTLLFCLMTRSGQGIGGTFTVLPNTVDIDNVIIASGENHGLFNHSLWRFWGWEFEAVGVSHPVDDQTYAPTKNAGVKTRYARFHIIDTP